MSDWDPEHMTADQMKILDWHLQYNPRLRGIALLAQVQDVEAQIEFLKMAQRNVIAPLKAATKMPE